LAVAWTRRSTLGKRLDGKIDDLARHMDDRFEQVDKRFEQVDKRFEQADKRFEAVEERSFRLLVAVFSGYGVLIAALIGVIATQG
jgi:hypothetical protein